MKTDDELDLWRQEWQSPAAVPAGLIKRVQRQTLLMRLHRMVALFVTLVIGGGTIVGAVETQDRYWILLACGTWFFIFVAWRFQLENWRGVWTPGAPTTAAYLDLCIERCERRIAAIRFTGAFGIVLSVFVFVIDYRLLSEEGSSLSGFWNLVGTFAVGVAGALILLERLRRRKRAELNALIALKEQLTASLLARTH